MTVLITFSNVSNGQTMEDTQDSGSVAPGAASTEIDIYIRHDGEQEITDCGWYLNRCMSLQYPEGGDPDVDLNEVRSWGDSGDGFRISQEDPFDTWTSFSSSVGTIDNQISLPGAAEIAADGEAHVKVKWIMPDPLPAETSAGQRGVTLVFAYSATS
jgi:hypothetical protein